MGENFETVRLLTSRMENLKDSTMPAKLFVYAFFDLKTEMKADGLPLQHVLEKFERLSASLVNK